jgi:cytochrome c2
LLSGISCLTAGASITVVLYQQRSQLRVTAEQIAGGSATAGKRTFVAKGCGSCHAIGEGTNGSGKVGPALDGIAVRSELAGQLANTPDNMRRWIQHPQRIIPGSGMPETGLSDTETRDVAAFLYTLT